MEKSKEAVLSIQVNAGSQKETQKRVKRKKNVSKREEKNKWRNVKNIYNRIGIKSRKTLEPGRKRNKGQK